MIDSYKSKIQYFSKQLFNDSTLHFRNIEIVDDLGESWAVTQPYISITKRYADLTLSKNIPTESVDIILIHEMIHLYTWLYNGTCDHGKDFKEWTNRLKSMGYYISEFY